MSEALILRTQENKFELLPEAQNLKLEALESTLLIMLVNSPETQKIAVEGQAKLKGVINLYEKNRKAAKEPLLAAGRQLDELIKTETDELNSEGMRLAGLVNEYQEKERIRMAAAKALADKELSEEERKRQELLAKAPTVAEADRINEESSIRAARIQATVKEAPRAFGQVVRTDWEIEVTNPYELAKFHPSCVNITPRMLNIKELLNQGIQVAGVKASKVVSSTVRAARAGPINI